MTNNPVIGDQLFNSGFWTLPKNPDDAITIIDYFLKVDLTSEKDQLEALTKNWEGIWFSMEVDAYKPLTKITLTRVIYICREPKLFKGFANEMHKYLFQIYTCTKLQ